MNEEDAHDHKPQTQESSNKQEIQESGQPIGRIWFPSSQWYREVLPNNTVKLVPRILHQSK